MGLLSLGQPFEWNESLRYLNYVRQKGVQQFIWLYQSCKSRSRDSFLWGDEIEYTVMRLDHEEQNCKLCLISTHLQNKLNYDERNKSKTEINFCSGALWRPEYAEYMIEGLPASPFNSSLKSINNLELNMKLRRKLLMNIMPDKCFPITLSMFPRLGCSGFTYPSCQANSSDSASCSLFFPDCAITHGHPRFKTLTRNIRSRRGKKAESNIPIFVDCETERPFNESIEWHFSGRRNIIDDFSKKSLPDHIYFDAMGFGMGCACLQTTFQTCCIDEARYLYDQLSTICPVLMALSASSPVARGFLLDTDCRWKLISEVTDDRTQLEMGCSSLRIQKSRFASISSYISELGQIYNDVHLEIDKTYYDEMIDQGVDHIMSQHVSHLFVRDPVVVYREQVKKEPILGETDHFENIQSTNWQSMRFKPPPYNSSIGWRVEFRATELQISDFENAAFVIFLVLLTKMILTFRLNFLIPISLADTNMEKAILRDAVRSQRFFFRSGGKLTMKDSPINLDRTCRNVMLRRSQSYPSSLHQLSYFVTCKSCRSKDLIDSDGNNLTRRSKSLQELVNSTKHSMNSPDSIISEMYINTILNGSNEFPGLIPLILRYLKSAENEEFKDVMLIYKYLEHISKKASGKLFTTAQWMRLKILEHPLYNKDSKVSDEICYDLMKNINDRSNMKSCIS